MRGLVETKQVQFIEQVDDRYYIDCEIGNHTIFCLDTYRSLTYLCAVTFNNNDYGKSYYVCKQ